MASQPAPPEEEEQLLPATELDALKEAFYKRYHIKPTPAKFPGDRLISKMVKSLGRGQLEVFDLWSVRSLVHQRTHGAKKRRLAENIFIHEEDKDEQAPRNWLNYLDKRISMRLPSQGSNLWHLHQPRQRRWQPAQRHIFGFHLTSCSRTSSDARK